MSILFFKKPEKVPQSSGPLRSEPGKPNTSPNECSYAAIPPELSFDNIVCNKCAPPCSLQDFLDYLTYVERRAENLQFYLWMVDYYQRFRNAPQMETALSPQGSSQPDANDMTKRLDEYEREMGSGPGLELDKYSEDVSSVSTWDCEQSEFSNNYTQTLDTLKFSISPVKHDAAHKKQISWPGSLISKQPFRAEINRIINHYIAVGSPRQLNLIPEDREAVIRALGSTTHPSALSRVKRMLDSTLRRESHPNFVRWSLCNGNKQWTLSLRIFAMINISIGFMIATILTLSRASRYWRIFAAIEWWFGITNIIAASQGLCVLLHRMHSRQYHPWETQDFQLEDDEKMLRGIDVNCIGYENTKSKWPVKMEVFGPANNYSGEAWVDSYHDKPWYRRLFEKRATVDEIGLRNMQNRMVRQAEAWAFLVTVPLTVVFVALPKGNFF